MPHKPGHKLSLEDKWKFSNVKKNIDAAKHVGTKVVGPTVKKIGEGTVETVKGFVDMFKPREKKLLAMEKGGIVKKGSKKSFRDPFKEQYD